MKIGLIDVDHYDEPTQKFPNLPLMKISAWHKQQGDEVVWYEPMLSGHCDIVYMSKIFSFTPDYPYFIDADEIHRGGSGYCIQLVDGKEVYHKENDTPLPYEIEHIYPDYSIYYDKCPSTKNTAYGFMSRGCPRGCDFCHVKDKEGRMAHKVADLSEFWNGQKKIELCDPNPIACKEWKSILTQLAESKASVNINQGLDIRMMNEEKAEYIKRIKLDSIHMAWDRYEDKDLILPKFKFFKEITGIDERTLVVYVLCNFNTTREQDFERIYTLREMGYSPYVMLYDKEHIPKGHELRRMQRWVNNRFIWRTTPRFEDYQNQQKSEDDYYEYDLMKGE